MQLKWKGMIKQISKGPHCNGRASTTNRYINVTGTQGSEIPAIGGKVNFSPGQRSRGRKVFWHTLVPTAPKMFGQAGV